MVAMLDLGGGGEPDPILFGIVRFEPGGDRRVSDTVITFSSPASADLFAVEQGWSDYQVTPLRFYVTEIQPPAGSRLYLDTALGRMVERRGGRL